MITLVTVLRHWLKKKGITISKITVIPNYAVLLNGDAFYLEASYPSLFGPLLRTKQKIQIAALVNKKPYEYQKNYFKKCLTTKLSLRILRIISQKENFLKKIWIYATCLPPLTKVIIESKFIYIFVPGNVGLLSLFLCLVFKKPFGIYLRGSLGLYNAKTQKALLWTFGYAKFICVTTKKKSVDLCKRGIDAFPVVPMSFVFEKKFKIGKKNRNKKVINLLFVGQTIAEKGIFKIINAFAEIRKTMSRKLQLIIVGSGSGLNLAQALSKKLKIDQHVKFLGPITKKPKLAKIYQEADIFILPTYYPEGFPRVLWEAAAFGLAIISSRTGEISSEISHGRSCLFCNPQSTESVRKMVRKVIVDLQLRKKLQKQAKQVWQNKKRQLNEFESHGDQVCQKLWSAGILEDPLTPLRNNI